MKKKKKNNFPTIYLDEHLNYIKRVFQSLRVIEISKTRLKGLDERCYISCELYKNNGIFVTSDREFIEDIYNSKHIKHAGIVFIPKEMSQAGKLSFGEIACGYIKGACTHSRFIWRNIIIYPGNDGLRTVYKDNDLLEFSWDWFWQELNKK